MGPAVEHGGAKYSGQVVEGHLVVLLQAGHLDEVFYQKHNTGLIRVLRKMTQQVQVGLSSGVIVTDAVGIQKIFISILGKN